MFPISWENSGSLLNKFIDFWTFNWPEKTFAGSAKNKRWPDLSLLSGLTVEALQCSQLSIILLFPLYNVPWKVQWQLNTECPKKPPILRDSSLLTHLLLRHQVVPGKQLPPPASSPRRRAFAVDSAAAVAGGQLSQLRQLDAGPVRPAVWWPACAW